MDPKNRRDTIARRIDKASTQLDKAKKDLESHYTYSDSVLAAQTSLEVSVKAIMSLLDIPFPPSHGWDRKQLDGIAKHINERQLLSRLKEQGLDYTIPLPRLIHRMNVWSKFYEESKYGFEVGDLASAQDLFEQEDALHAVKHAEDAYRAALHLLHRPDDQLTALVGG